MEAPYSNQIKRRMDKNSLLLFNPSHILPPDVERGGLEKVLANKPEVKEVESPIELHKITYTNFPSLQGLKIGNKIEYDKLNQEDKELKKVLLLKIENHFRLQTCYLKERSSL